MSKYSQLITKLFDTNSKFVSEDFYEFVGEITKRYPNDRITLPPIIDQDGNRYIREDICEYTDDNGDKMAIMIYKMPSKTKVERARSEQRNLISAYLKNTGVFNGVNSVLVAFYCDDKDSNDWRLSFVKQEFKLSETELDTKGRPKIINELTPAKRFSFLVESNSRNLTVKQRLGDLISDRVLIADIEKAFSVEKVSKEFFEKYVGLYERLSKAFEKDEVFKKVEEENNNGDEHFRENFVKKLLGQIVFLYFLQKKGWLGVKKDEKWGDGDKNFLQNLFRECTGGGNPKKESGGKNFFNDYLEWLFYDNLNRKRENDYSDYFECRIPYLNGGLFEPINGYDWKGVANVLLAGDDNNAIFRDIFETFDEYNFTVYENDPLEQDVAVDPEMLGKVFENLLPENERKGKGAFYTPREIVHYMCKESLKSHLMNKTGISEEKINGLFDRKDSMLNLKRFGEKLSDADRFSQFGEYIDYAEKIVSSLKTIKVVDPAVGSGAFPMGLLKEIVSLRKYLQDSILLEENVSEYTIKKETLENCIYGVDLDPGAVEIAKLRFWLSLVIEEESKESIDPLPNLDYKIIQGNSLIEDIVVGETVIKLDIEGNSKKLTKKQSKEIGNASQIGLGFFADETEQEDTLKKLKFLHKRFFQEKDNVNKKKLKEEIDHVEKELIRISGEVEVNRIRTKIESIEGKYLLSGGSPDTKDSKEIERLSTQIQGIKDMEEKYKRDNVRTFFPWKLHFAEVFNENGGFDIVIGNPPYVGQKGNKETLELVQKGNLKEFSQGKMDLFYYFFHLGLNISKEKSQIGFITTNYYVTALGGKKLRSDFKNRVIIRKLLNLNELKIFESAKGQHNIITLLEKGQNINFISKNCITSRKGYYLDLNGGKVLDDILNGIDIETQYFSVEQNNVYDGIENYIRLGGLGGSNKINIILNKIYDAGTPLGKIKEVNNGIQSGCDKINDKGVFLLKSNEVSLIDKNEHIHLMKYYKNSDIFRYGTSGSTNLSIIYTDRGINGDSIPSIKKHLFNFIDRLRNIREVKNNVINYYNLQWPRNKEIFLGEKIVFPQRSKVNTFGYNNIHWFGGTDLFFITNKSINDEINLKYILSILNSKLCYTWLYNRGKRKGEYLELIGQPIKEIPINQISQELQKPFIDLVDQILEVTKKEDYLEREDLQNQVKELEKQIDDLVYELYELTPEEIELVESSMKK